MTVDEAIKDIRGLVRDNDVRLVVPDDFRLGLKMALGTYSRYKPNSTVAISQVTNNCEVLLSNVPGFDEGFVDMMEVEYPVIGYGEPLFLDASQYVIVFNEDQERVIRFTDIMPPAGDDVKIHYQVKHTIPPQDDDVLTVYDSDTDAVVALSAAWCLRMLANAYLKNEERGILAADFANYGDKSNDCQARADSLEKVFELHMEGPESRKIQHSGTVELIRS